MVLLMTYNLFISHSWAYSDAYNQLVNLLNGAKNFDYKNYSVPQDNPIHNAHNDKQLKEAIQKQMQPPRLARSLPVASAFELLL